jgi:hypothetical protein
MPRRKAPGPVKHERRQRSFEILADELARMGQQIAHLQRTSLNKTEAEALNQQLVQGVASMAQTGQAVYEAISERMDLRLEKLAMETILAATDAASRAIEKSHAETSSAARDYAKAAGEARREAWRYFGGFWVWLASVGAGGAVLGLLAAFLIMGRVMRASSANILKSTAPPQGARSLPIRKAVGSAPSGSTARLSLGLTSRHPSSWQIHRLPQAQAVGFRARYGRKALVLLVLPTE